MPLDDMQHKLSKNEISEYKKKGHDLADDKTYLFRFLFNDKLNDAADPKRFKLATEDLDRYAKQAIGRPFIVRPDGNPYHVRVDETDDDNQNIKNMINLQKNYAVGDIKSTVRHPSNNVYGIIEVYDEYVDDIPTFAPYTSVTFYLYDTNGDDVKDGEFLNVQAVPDPGYAKSLAGIKGTCTGGIAECTRELRVLGAAGGLKEARSAGNLGINTSSAPNNNMSGDPNAMNETQKLDKIVGGVTALTETVADVQKQVLGITGILKEVGEKTGVDTSKLGGEGMPPKNDKPAGGEAPPAGGAPPAIAGASGQTAAELTPAETTQKITELEKRLKQESKLREDAEAKTAMTERTALAKTIAESQAQLHLIEAKDIPEKIKELVESKNGDIPQDLTLTANILHEQVSRIAGASGFQKDYEERLKSDTAIIGAGGAGNSKAEAPKNSAMMDAIM